MYVYLILLGIFNAEMINTRMWPKKRAEVQERGQLAELLQRLVPT
jgi:hypothetical protein